MKAVKANKEYTITEMQKQYYLNEGYDIINDNGETEYSPKKVIVYSKYAELEKELEEAKTEIAQLKKKKKTE